MCPWKNSTAEDPGGSGSGKSPDNDPLLDTRAHCRSPAATWDRCSCIRRPQASCGRESRECIPATARSCWTGRMPGADSWSYRTMRASRLPGLSPRIRPRKFFRAISGTLSLTAENGAWRQQWPYLLMVRVDIRPLPPYALHVQYTKYGSLSSIVRCNSVLLK